jgi:ubiquinone/menaquinone biosynthesis C-methylase UbiE
LSQERTDYLPALRFRVLTPLFDGVVRTTMRERRFKEMLLDQAGLKPGQRVLDLGCGTGTLALMAAEREPALELVGLDADPQILERARRKATAAGAEIRFDEGLSTELPYEDASFDRVFSTLFFHHLKPADKRLTAAEVARVLRPGGELHVADFGPPGDPLMRVAFGIVRLVDGRETTQENMEGRLPAIFEDNGLMTEECAALRTSLGRLRLYRGRVNSSRASVRRLAAS